MLKTPARLASLHLHLAGVAGELHRRHHVLRHAGGADRVALGLQPARGVDRQRAVERGWCPRGSTFQPSPGAARPIASYSIISAMVKQSWVSTRSRSVTRDARGLERAGPGAARALEGGRVAAREREEVVDVRAGAEGDGALESGRGLGVGEDQRGRAVGDERAVGAAQRAGDVGVLVARRCCRTRSRGPSAGGRTGCGCRSRGSWRRSSRARPSGRRSAGSRCRAISPKMPAKPPSTSASSAR